MGLEIAIAVMVVWALYQGYKTVKKAIKKK